MDLAEKPQPEKKQKFIPFVVQIIFIYILFASSIIISISYTELTVFHQLTFNLYVWNKILVESLKNTFFAVIVSFIITYGLHYFRKPKIIATLEEKLESSNGGSFISENNIVVATATFLIFAFTSLPLYTSISTFYVGDDGTFFELNFVHFTSLVKIIISLVIVMSTFVLLKYKYKYISRDLFTVLCILVFLSARGIFITQNKNFATAEAELTSIYNSDEQFQISETMDKAILDKVDPLAVNLVKIATTKNDLSTAYYWMARINSDEGNLEQALKYINLSASYRPYMQSEYLIRSGISFKMGNIEQSKKEALKCQDLVECVLRVGYIYVLDNNYKTALAYFQRAYDLYPEQIYVKKYLEYYSKTPLPVERIDYITLLGGTKLAEMEFDQCLSPKIVAYNKQFDALCVQFGKPLNCTSLNTWEAEGANATLNKELIACHIPYIRRINREK